MGKAAAVDIESLENAYERLYRYAPIVSPTDNIKVFLAGFDAIKDAVEQNRLVVKCSSQKPVVAFVEFLPKALAVQMLQPAGS